MGDDCGNGSQVTGTQNVREEVKEGGKGFDERIPLGWLLSYVAHGGHTGSIREGHGGYGTKVHVLDGWAVPLTGFQCFLLYIVRLPATL